MPDVSALHAHCAGQQRTKTDGINSSNRTATNVALPAIGRAPTLAKRSES